ncbi:hypothetical protein [Marinospirillum minutulum]|nr:hypothetical protein [Marinospirillum minutulum]
MTLKFYNSPFHATHDKETARKMLRKIDLSILLKSFKKEPSLFQ